MNLNILIIEDDSDINRLLSDTLSCENYTVHSAFSGSEALLCLNLKEWHLVILDLMLPGESGKNVLKVIREKFLMPVIVLSAKLDKESKLNVLSLGADDFITKPFDIDELLARVQAQLRRFTRFSSINTDDTLTYLDIKLNSKTREVYVCGTLIELTTKEFDILELFMKNPKKVFSRANIFESIWHEEFFGDEKTINVHISNLRSKLNNISDNSYIKTIWGIGFKLSE